MKTTSPNGSTTLTKKERELIIRLYRAGMLQREVAQAVGRSISTVSKTLLDAKVPIVNHRGDNCAYLPTAEEIERATARIREKWDEEEYWRRSMRVQLPYTVPEILPGPRRNGRVAFGE